MRVKKRYLVERWRTALLGLITLAGAFALGGATKNPFTAKK